MQGHFFLSYFFLSFSVKNYDEHFEPIDNEDNPDLLVENWLSLKELYQLQGSNIENHRFKKSPNKWNVNNNVVDNLQVLNNNLTNQDKVNFINVDHSNEQQDKAIHEKQIKVFIPHVFTAESRSNGFKNRRLKRKKKMSEDVIQIDNGANDNDEKYENVNDMRNQKHKQKETQKISIDNDAVTDSTVRYIEYI